MRSPSHRKQIILFLAAVIVPSLVLVAMTLRMIEQERELAQKRMVEERHRLASEIGQSLLIRLEKIKLEEASEAATAPQKFFTFNYKNPEVVLVSPVKDGQMLCPWELNPAPQESRQLLSRVGFWQKIQEAERVEFDQRQPVRAAQLFRQAMITAPEGSQKEFARLLMARGLAKSGKKNEALAQYKIL